MDIILYLLTIIQYLYQMNCWLLNFICRYIPLKQWTFDDSHSPKYQEFKIDELPRIQFHQHEWQWTLLIPYFKHRYGKKIRPISRRKPCDIPDDCCCYPVAHRNHISTAITAKPGSSAVRSAAPTSPRKKTAFLNSSLFAVLIVGKLLWLKKNGNTSSSINA